ncbi:hypothetical protein B0H65DRAFT_116780 [Neurospora tetraspora]|uniref:Uncharacterized protein n=1 Tax=Neurospora tetraspora TaxID=94610 RepID=A0AAE0JKE7_9PEZI|nr:hypothetical protein B0H65DRAFT_116780 [Neurospora tetraspora]
MDVHFLLDFKVVARFPAPSRSLSFQMKGCLESSCFLLGLEFASKMESAECMSPSSSSGPSPDPPRTGPFDDRSILRDFTFPGPTLIENRRQHPSSVFSFYVHLFFIYNSIYLADKIQARRRRVPCMMLQPWLPSSPLHRATPNPASTNWDAELLTPSCRK